MTELPIAASYEDLMKILGVTKRTIRRYVVQGILPPPVRLGHKTVRWGRSVLEPALETLLNPAA